MKKAFCLLVIFLSVFFLGEVKSAVPDTDNNFYNTSSEYNITPEDTVIYGPDGFRKMMLLKESLDFVESEFIPLQISELKELFNIESFSIQPKEINIIAVGDIMPGTNYPNESYLPQSCSDLFSPVKELIQSADVSIGNLEGVFSSEGGTAKNCNDPKTCYVFRMPDQYASCIKDAGFDILGMANNHINDFGPVGRMNTVKVLQKEGFYFAGFPEFPYTIMERDGLKLGFCAFAPHTGTLSLKEYDAASGIVQHLDSLCDIVIVSFHGGAEGRNHQHVTRKDEDFLGYNRGNVHLFAHTVIDAGADLVIGHGPHVVRAIEFYKEKLIAYSLGNFCTYARFNISGPNANAPLLQVWLDEQGNFLKGKIHSYIQLGEGGPVGDPDKNAARRIQELTVMDFPEQSVLINDEGWIISESISPKSPDGDLRALDND